MLGLRVWICDPGGGQDQYQTKLVTQSKTSPLTCWISLKINTGSAQNLYKAAIGIGAFTKVWASLVSFGDRVVSTGMWAGLVVGGLFQTKYPWTFFAFL